MTRLRERMQEQGLPHSAGQGGQVLLIDKDGNFVDDLPAPDIRQNDDGNVGKVDKSRIRMLLNRMRQQIEQRRLQYTDGGPGSGNHGHAGRPGKRGGSAPGKFKNMGATCAERNDFRNKLAKDCLNQIHVGEAEYFAKESQYHKAKTEMDTWETEWKRYKPLDGVTKDNFEEKEAEYFDKYQKLKEIERTAFDKARRSRKKADSDAWQKAAEVARQAYYDHEIFNHDPDLVFKERDELKAQKPGLQKQLDNAKQEMDKAEAEQQKHIAAYRKDLAQMNAMVVKKYYKKGGPKTLEEVDEYLNAKGYFDNSVRDSGGLNPKGTPSLRPAVSFKGCDEDLAVSVCKSIHKMYKKFPDMAGFVQTLLASKSNSSVMGWYTHRLIDTGGDICINTNYFNTPNKGSILHYDGTFHPEIKSSNPYFAHDATTMHELGHALDGFLCQRYPDVAEQYAARGRNAKARTVAAPILKQAAKNLGMTQTALKQSISQYACKKHTEALAEAFSEYMCSDTPRPAVAEVGRQLYSLYTTGKLAGKERTR